MKSRPDLPETGFAPMQPAASVLHFIHPRPSFIGLVYRGMLISQTHLDKYIVGSRILNTAFLSTSTDRSIAEIFAGIDTDQPSSAVADPGGMRWGRPHPPLGSIFRFSPAIFF